MDTLFFYLSKVFWLLLAPDKVFVLALLLSWLALWRGWRRLGMGLLGGVVLLTLGVSVLPVVHWPLMVLEQRFPTPPALPTEVDGIIVLGGPVMAETSAEWGQLETNTHAERLHAMITLARRFPRARLVFTGGSASLIPGRPGEAGQVLELLLAAGIERERLYLEDRARNTAENVTLSRALMQPRPGETWLLVSTAFHLPRAVGLFCRQGWPVIPYPVDHQTRPSQWLAPGFDPLGNAEGLKMGIREWLGLLAYWLSGRTPALLPQTCPDAGRAS